MDKNKLFNINYSEIIIQFHIVGCHGNKMQATAMNRRAVGKDPGGQLAIEGESGPV